MNTISARRITSNFRDLVPPILLCLLVLVIVAQVLRAFFPSARFLASPGELQERAAAEHVRSAGSSVRGSSCMQVPGTAYWDCSVRVEGSRQVVAVVCADEACSSDGGAL